MKVIVRTNLHLGKEVLVKKNRQICPFDMILSRRQKWQAPS